MTGVASQRRQRGVVTIFVSMILLLLITLLVVTAYSLSSMNLRAVGNVQARDEALAAANTIIERTISLNFWEITTAATDQGVDLNADGVTDYLVDIEIPRCVRATPIASTTSASVTLPGMTSTSAWNTTWEFDATATEATTGTRVRVLQGVRTILNSTLKEALCI
jgi:Tfp pilus assembly protein PilX